MADKNFIVKNGLEVGGQEVVSSSGVVTSAALGGQTLASTDSPTFNNLTLTNDIAVGGDLNLTGDLNITGDVNSLSVTDLDVTDQTITLGAGQVESASGGSGIIVDGSGASILWDETNDQFDINKGLNVTGEAEFANKLKVYSENNAVVAIDSLSNAYMVIDRSADDRRGALVFSTAAADVFSSPPATGTINWALGVSDSDELSGNKFAIKTGDTNFSNAQFVIDTSGNVGIGTTNPGGYRLNVSKGSTGDIAQITDGIAQTFIFRSDSNSLYAGNANNFPLAFVTNNTERMRIGSDGIVHISDTSGATLDINTNLGGADSKILLHEGTSTSPANGASIRYDGSSNKFQIGVGSSVDNIKLTILRDTNRVGIISTAPNANLHVGNTVSQGSQSNPAIQIGGDVNYRLGMYTGNEDAIIENKNGDDGIAFRVKTAGEAMRIDGGTGNVGIGTSNPQAKLNTNLQVEGSILAYMLGTSTTFDGGKNVAVTHSSSALGTGTAGGLLLANNNNSNGAPSPLIAFSARSTSSTYNHTYATIHGEKTSTGADSNWNTGALIFSTGSGTGPNERMRIDSSGNLLVNQTSAGVNGKLQVTGGIGLTGNSEIRQSTNSDGSTLRFLGTQFVAGSSNAVGYSYSSGALIASVSNSANVTLFEAGASNTSGHRLTIQNDATGLQGEVKYAGSEPVFILRDTRSAGGTAWSDSANEPLGEIEFWTSDGTGIGPHAVARIRTVNDITAASPSGAITFMTSGYNNGSPSERMRITSAGHVAIASGKRFYFNVNSIANGDTYIDEYSANEVGITTGGSRKLAVSGGNLYVSGSVNANHNFSDERLKENVVVIPNALQKVSSLRGITFTRKDDGSVGTGLIAQELEAVLPEAVYEAKMVEELENPDAEAWKSINYGNTVGLLVEAIKEQQTIIENLQSRLDEAGL